MGLRNIIFSLMKILSKFFAARYSLVNNNKEGETIFKNICASCYVRGGVIVSKG